MSISSDVEEAREMVFSITEEFVTETQDVTPEDMYFVSRLLHEYYDSQSADDLGSEQSCVVAWSFASKITSYVEEKDDFDWLNAYFTLNSAFKSLKSDYIEYPDRAETETEPPTHFDTFLYDSEALDDAEMDDGTASMLDEIQEVVELYVDFDGSETEIDGMDKPAELSMVLNHIGKRYASHFPSDMIESAVGMQLITLLLEFREDEDFSPWAVYHGVRMATEWAEWRSKREHEMLCVGTK